MCPPSPDISVIVCSHNGGQTVRTALRALAEQSLDPNRFEVIAVDDGSTDETLSVMRESAARVLSLSPNRGLAAARNAGVAAARSPLVAFTDDDCEPGPGWLGELLAGFSDPSVAGLSGTVTPAGTPCFSLRYLQRRNPLQALGAELVGARTAVGRLRRYVAGVVGIRRPLSSGDELYAVVGANMAFRREVVTVLGGFDEAFRFGSEEEELCIRLHAQPTRRRLVFAPAAHVAHHFKPGLRDSIRRSRSYGRGNARRAIKHPSTRPIVYPFPFVVACGALATLTRMRSHPQRMGMAVLMPLALYPRWIADLRASRGVEPLTYPYIEMLQETWTMLGEVDGYRLGVETAAEDRRTRSARPRSTPAP